MSIEGNKDCLNQLTLYVSFPIETKKQYPPVGAWEVSALCHGNHQFNFKSLINSRKSSGTPQLEHCYGPLYVFHPASCFPGHLLCGAIQQSRQPWPSCSQCIYLGRLHLDWIITFSFLKQLHGGLHYSNGYTLDAFSNNLQVFQGLTGQRRQWHRSYSFQIIVLLNKLPRSPVNIIVWHLLGLHCAACQTQ